MNTPDRVILDKNLHFMKIIIWIVFYTSIFGMFLSTALRANFFRELIVEAWATVTIRLEKLPANFSITLFGKLLNIFYCQNDNKISKKKIFFISLITSIAWYLFIYDAFAEEIKPISDDQRVLFFGHLSVILFTTIQFYLLEYLQAYSLLFIFSKIKERKSSFLFPSLALLSIFFYTASYFVLILFRDHLPRTDSYKHLLGFLIPLIAPIWIPLLWLNNSNISATKLIIMLPFSLTLMNGLIFIFFTLLISNSKLILKLLAKSIENLAASTYNKIFNYSMIAFAISTGSMQAYTF